MVDTSQSDIPLVLCTASLADVEMRWHIENPGQLMPKGMEREAKSVRKTHDTVEDLD